MLVCSTPLGNKRPSNAHPPLPCENKYRGTCILTRCNGGGGGRGPQTHKHLPPSTFTGLFLRKPDIYGLVSWQIFDPCLRPHLCYRFFSGGVRIACAECHPPLEMCAECFAARVEVGNHKSYHSYRYNYHSQVAIVRFKAVNVPTSTSIVTWFFRFTSRFLVSLSVPHVFKKI